MDDGRLKTGLGKALTGPDEELVLLVGISHAVGAVVVGYSEVLEQAQKAVSLVAIVSDRRSLT